MLLAAMLTGAHQPGKGDDVICTAALEDTRKTWLLLLLLLIGLHDHYYCRLQFLQSAVLGTALLCVYTLRAGDAQANKQGLSCASSPTDDCSDFSPASWHQHDLSWLQYIHLASCSLHRRKSTCGDAARGRDGCSISC